MHVHECMEDRTADPFFSWVFPYQNAQRPSRLHNLQPHPGNPWDILTTVVYRAPVARARLTQLRGGGSCLSLAVVRTYACVYLLDESADGWVGGWLICVYVHTHTYTHIC